MPELLQMGKEFAGYRLRAVLGRGGRSIVYQAENRRPGNVAALRKSWRYSASPTSTRPGASVTSDGPGRPARRRRVRRRRARGQPDPRLLWGLIVFVIAAATVGGIFAARAGQGPSKAGPSALSKPPAPSRLVSVLGQTERFTGRLRMSACKSVGLTNVQCYRPDPAIAAVTFATYKSLAALYTKYREIVGNLTRGAPLAAVENKGRSGTAPEPTDESTWNHSNVYSAKYTINQMASGNVPADVAMGRVFCGQTPNGSAVFVWTQDSGDLLGYATGSDASHEEVWQWFDEIHHQVIFPGQPAMTARATSSWP